MYQLIGLEQIQPLAEIQWKVAKAYRTATQRWEALQPKLSDLGVAFAGVVLTTMVLTVYAGVTAGKFYRRLRFAAETGLLAWQHYSEEIKPLEFEVLFSEVGPQTADADTPIVFPPVDNEALESPDPSPETIIDDDIPTVPDLKVVEPKRRGRKPKA